MMYTTANEMENMSLEEIKRTLSDYQKDGRWNQGLQYLCALYRDNPIASIGCLVISEMYWLYKDRYDYNPEGIDWSFLREMGVYLKDLLSMPADPEVYWYLYYMMSIDFCPFVYSMPMPELQTIYKNIAHVLDRSRNSKSLDNLIALTADENFTEKTHIDFETISADIDGLHLQENFSDQEILYELEGLVNYKYIRMMSKPTASE